VRLRLADGQHLRLRKGTVLGTLRTVRNAEIRSISTINGTSSADETSMPNAPQGTTETSTPDAPRSADEEKFAKFLKKSLDALPQDVNENMKSELVKVLTKHKATLCSTTLGETSVTTFDIVLNPGGPVTHRDRRWSHEELATMKEQIEMLSKMGMIEASESDWASRLVLVTKKDGSIRVCVDYRDVNALTKRDAYPSPQIDQR
jgi:hypothetical protein